MSKCVWMAVVLLLLGGCKKDDGDPTPAGATGGMVAAGTGGMAPSTGGTPGTGGMAPSTGGTPGTGGAPAASTVPGCSAAVTGTPAELHAGAVEALAAPAAMPGAPPSTSSCGFMSCHVGTGKAGLILSGAMNLNTLLVGKASCQVPAIPLVDGAGMDAGLNHSWLWLKLTKPVDANMNIVPDAAWGTPGSCEQRDVGSFGQLMPWGNSMPMAEAKLAKIRNWICAGAPAP